MCLYNHVITVYLIKDVHGSAVLYYDYIVSAWEIHGIYLPIFLWVISLALGVLKDYNPEGYG